jgi:hypothetical protein
MSLPVRAILVLTVAAGLAACDRSVATGPGVGSSTSSSAPGVGAEIRQDAREAVAGASTAIGDASITTQVNAALAMDKDLAATRIDVDTQAGAVSLRGEAPTEAARERAARLVQVIAGVTSVRNELQVVGTPSR